MFSVSFLSTFVEVSISHIYLNLPFSVGTLYAVHRDEEPNPLDWWKESGGERCFQWRHVEVIVTPRSVIKRLELRRRERQLQAV